MRYATLLFTCLTLLLTGCAGRAPVDPESNPETPATARAKQKASPGSAPPDLQSQQELDALVAEVMSEAPPLRVSLEAQHEDWKGVPYRYGGLSPRGVDCSGFVMQSYAMNGINLPRDTDEMANTGRLIGFQGWTDALLPGDLLFFSGSRRLVTHTALYLGEGRVIHSLGSGVQIQSLNPGDDDYAANLAERFIFAKRIIE